MLEKASSDKPQGFLIIICDIFQHSIKTQRTNKFLKNFKEGVYPVDTQYCFDVYKTPIRCWQCRIDYWVV